ncbi:MAG: hypothetical protein K8T89_02715 [Planctomycetes bacterium]|nr:hypothetical protein [Planctomycetota bacterium]
MEPLRTKQISRINRRTALAGMACAALAPLGCFALGKTSIHKEEPKAGQQGRLVSAWENKIVYAPDASRGGETIPGLTGRVYLFGPDLNAPYLGDGKLLIDLFDATPHGQGAPPKMIEHYIYPADVLQKLTKKDVFGDGYTLFLPWATYRPDISHIYILMRYDTVKGEQFFHQSGTFSVDHGETVERVKKGMSVTNAAFRETK